MGTKDELVVAIDEFIKEHGYAPTYREMCEMVDVRSTSTIQSLLMALRSDGVLDFERGKPRTVRLL